MPKINHNPNNQHQRTHSWASPTKTDLSTADPELQLVRSAVVSPVEVRDSRPAETSLAAPPKARAKYIHWWF